MLAGNDAISEASATAGPRPGHARSRLIDRHDLVTALDQAVAKRVTILSAPAGSGKTSLLQAWASRPRPARRIAFMSVKPGQHDTQLFWLALLGTVRAATGSSEPSPAAPGFNARPMVAKALSELTTSGEPFFLIIDDLHELSSADATEQLGTLMTGLPPAVHAILATRRDPAMHLHQLRLAGELAEIRGPQLRFTRDETRMLLAAGGITLPDPVLATLHQRTEGWAAGLRLAVLSLTGHPHPEQFVAEFSGSERTVAEYLMAEMLEHQPPQVQRLLLRTSLLDRVNGELADILTGAIGSERILLDLEDANAFVVSLDAARTWFRYHHMISGLLRLELRRTTPGDVPELHRRAARWLADQGDIADAIRHLQAAGAWPEAARLLTDHALSLTLDGQGGTVVSLLRSFPASTGEDSSGLALVHAIADLDELRLDRADAHLAVAKAYAATASSDRQYRLRMAISSVELLSARLRGRLDGVFDRVGALPSPTAGHSPADLALGSDQRAVALLNLGVSEAWSLRLADSEHHLQEGAALARDIGRPYLEVACLAHLGFAATAHSFSLAERHCQDAIALAARHGWESEAVIVPAQATLAGVLIWTGEFNQGELWLNRARAASPAPAEPGVQLLLHLVSATLPAARGRYQEALSELLAAWHVQALMGGQHALTSRIIGWTIATHARLGNIDQARAALAAVDERLAAAGEIRNAAATIRLAEQDPVRARRELKAVLYGNDPTKRPRTLIEAHLLDALACRDLGDERASGDALERALQLAERDRLILLFAMTGAWKLLSALPPRGTAHAALVTDILDAINGGEPNHLSTFEPAEQLSPSELRVLRYLPTNLTRPEIAGQLSVSVNTVNTHIRRIYTKLAATDRSSAVRRGRELRLLSSGRAGAHHRIPSAPIR